MKIKQTGFQDLLLLSLPYFADSRGVFHKTFSLKDFSDIGLDFRVHESFYSVSKKYVLRGMHFQIPPHEHDKLVVVTEGEIIDVVLDLRKSSDTFQDFFKVKISSGSKFNSLFIPKGFAHGFLSLSDNTRLQYFTNSNHNKNSDLGLHFESFGCDWEFKRSSFIMSDRDSSFPSLEDFNSPF